MSNTQVGGVYQQIINDVIAASRVDFEEGGIDETVLEQLKKGWQKKLSQQQLATFPWDPKPEPPPPAPAPAPQSATGPSVPQPAPNGNGYAQPQPPAPQAVPMPMPAAQSVGDARIKTEPAVKVEPGLEGNQMSQPMPQGDPSNIAQQRVIAQLQNQYGERAAASINKLREQPTSSVAPPQNQQRMANQPMPQAYPAQYQNNAQQQYRPNVPHNPVAQQQRVPMVNGQRPPNSQVDGADDDSGHIGILLHQGLNGDTKEVGRMEIDSMLHTQIAARAKAMEGGGLMVPLKRANKGKSVAYRAAGENAGLSQFDGPDDDIKDEDEVDSDEDAINSDLDDPDDNVEGDEDDEEGGQIMLCMYDKVQRVKNKWKCVLKDGVLNVGGKDYVFHKATGEYEW
ncbi:putative transcription factor alpha beta subunit [Rosellinia necatrix]|uniref:Transcription initiation factor IIA large subunit n=1 Tax=Rosellinia necatrix TaxID=77044 RepID=A0A1S7UMG2_ROSNE|nr:putative transcription factor alpha beta subunit [Rosellinia necatrix]